VNQGVIIIYREEVRFLVTYFTVTFKFHAVEAGRSIMMVGGLSSGKERGSITVSTS
jgi:hypothetical protein